MSEEQEKEVALIKDPGQVRQLSLREFLVNEYNKNLMEYCSVLIEAEWLSLRDPKEVVFRVIQPSGQPGIPGIERKISAKDAQFNARQKLDKLTSILKVNQSLIKKEEELEKNGKTHSF